MAKKIGGLIKSAIKSYSDEYEDFTSGQIEEFLSRVHSGISHKQFLNAFTRLGRMQFFIKTGKKRKTEINNYPSPVYTVTNRVKITTKRYKETPEPKPKDSISSPEMGESMFMLVKSLKTKIQDLTTEISRMQANNKEKIRSLKETIRSLEVKIARQNDQIMKAGQQTQKVSTFPLRELATFKSAPGGKVKRG